MNVWWSVVLAAGALAGTWLIGNRRRAGWLVNFVFQLLWIAYSISSGQWGFLASSAVFAVVNVRYYVRWGRRDEAEVRCGEDSKRLDVGAV